MAEQFANLAQTSLSGSVGIGDATITVLSAVGFPTTAQYRVRIDNEILLVTGGAGSLSWAVTRGAEGSPAAAHGNGTQVVHVLTAAALGGQSDPAAGTPGLRSLGTGAQQAMPGTPSSGSIAASAITAGSNGQFLQTVGSTPTWSTASVSVLDETLWSSDPRVGAVGNGTTDDAAAINTGIAMAVAAGGGRFALVPSSTYLIKSPLEILGRCKFGGIEARNTFIKQDPTFAPSHMLRNWTTADYNTGIGEDPLGRAVPAARLSGGAHVNYPQVDHLHFQAVKANTSLIGWIAPQETSYFDDLILDTVGLSATNQGIWGIDMQAQSADSFNGGRIQNIVGYGLGWERFLSLDGEADGGSDSYIDNIFPSPATCYHSVIYVNRVVDVEVSRLHMEQQTDAGAQALIYLRSAFGFTLRGGGMTVKQAQAAPFLRQVARPGGGTFETPPLIDGFYFYDSMSSGSWDTAWPAGFIIDLFNTIPNPPNISSGATLHAAQMIHRYDGSQMTWTDNAQGRFQTFFKKPDIKGLTDVQLNSTYLSCAGLSTVNNQGYTTPDHADFDLTDVDLRILIQPTAWAQAATATLIDKHNTGGQYSYQFFLDTAGKLGLAYTTDGSTVSTLHSSVAASGTGNVWVRVVASITNTIFYTSTDGASWTQLGTTQAALTGAIFNSTRAPAVGENSTTDGRYAGRILKAEFRTAAGTLKSNLDLTFAIQGAAITDPQGHVWTPGANSLIAYDQRLDPSKIAPGVNGQVLTMVGGVPTWV